MFGKIEYENFVEVRLPQKAQSAWDGALGSLVGATYKPLLYIGKQQVHGTNFFFIVEQTLITNPPIRRLVKLVIHELDGEYKLASVEEI